MDLREAAKKQEHLDSEHQAKLLKILTDNEEVVQGMLGGWRGPKINIELQQGVQTIPRQAVPRATLYPVCVQDGGCVSRRDWQPLAKPKL